MKNKSLLMPHRCQIIGWWLFLLAILVDVIKTIFFRDLASMETAGSLARASSILFLVSLFFICLSKEKVEDEMISSLRLRAVGITAYVFFVLLLILSIVLEVRPGFLFSGAEDTLSAYLSEFFLIILPVLLFVLYYLSFRWMLWKSKKQQAL